MTELFYFSSFLTDFSPVPLSARDQVRQEMRGVADQAALDARQQAEQKAQTSELDRDIAAEGMSVDFEVRDAEASVDAILHSIDAKGQRDLTEDQLAELAKLMGQAEDAAMSWRELALTGDLFS